MKLSDNFYLSEFTRSRTAIQNDFKEQFSPPSNVINGLGGLVQNILQPLRVEFQNRIYITSGYRCERVNTAVGGSANSDHMRGMASDVTCSNTEQLYNLCLAMNLPFKQLIWYKNRNFVHMSYDKNDVRRQSWVQT